MHIKGIGVNLPANQQVSDLANFGKNVSYALSAGLDVIEIPIQGLEVIKNGELNEKRLEKFLRIAEAYPIKFTTHAPYYLNLFSQRYMDVEIKLLESSLKVAHAFGAEVMVYHAGRFIPEEQFLYPHLWTHYSDKEIEELLKRERDILREVGDIGSKFNVKIGVENTRPYLDCAGYSYSEIPIQLAEQIKTINHPNIGITLDTGHIFMAVKEYNLNLQSEMNALAPFVVHLHIHDNHGIPCYSWEKNQFELLPRGRGDMHMPIGECSVPILDIVGCLPNYDGFWINEIRERYKHEWPILKERYEQVRFTGIK
jgi:sugar phosphate isomerase/epimerase